MIPRVRPPSREPVDLDPLIERARPAVRFLLALVGVVLLAILLVQLDRLGHGVGSWGYPMIVAYAFLALPPRPSPAGVQAAFATRRRGE